MIDSTKPRTQNGEQGTSPRILTNMAFWQSPVWTENTQSIYPMNGRTSDPSFDSPWMETWKLVARRGSYDVVVTMGARASLLFGLACAMMFQKPKQIMCEVFIDAPRHDRLTWRWKTALYRFIARKSLGILTNSSTEVQSIAKRFQIPSTRLRYVPMHSNIHTPEQSQRNDGFVLSAGRTLRDYDTLLEAAHHIKAPVVIIAGRCDPLPTSLPANVSVLREVSREQYLDTLKRCAVVALPLLPSERSTGQVVLLEAMAYGKPIVATRAPGTIDHIQHEKNGLLVEAGDSHRLADEVNRLLGNAELACHLGKVAVEEIRTQYTFDTHAKTKLQAINDLWRSSADATRNGKSQMLSR